MSIEELRPEQYRAQIAGGRLPSSTRDVAALDHLAGQDRALEAIRFGLDVTADGYNIIVSGPMSSGRNTAVMQLVSALAPTRPAPGDWFYLYSFADPYRPRAASLPAGLGVKFQRDMARLAEACRSQLPAAFEDDSYRERSQKVLEPVAAQRDRLIENLQRVAAGQGFTVNVTPMGFVAMPVGQDGRPLAPEVLASLPQEIRETIQGKGAVVEEAIQSTVREFRRLDTEATAAVDALDRDVLKFVVGHVLDELREAYGAYDGIGGHLDAIETDIAENLGQYKGFTRTAIQQLPPQLVAQAMEEREQLLRRYSVNLFVSHTDPTAGAPIVREQHPTYFNLFGRIDYEARMGALTTDFTRIRPGSAHQANGGYLIIQLEDLLSDGRAWLMLKRALKTHEVRVEGIGDLVMPFPSVNLVPEPMPFHAEVILVGQPQTVAIVEALDPDFPQLFKARAEFEPDVPADEENTSAYVAFVRRAVDTCPLPPFNADALAEVVHYGHRLAGRQDRLSARYGAIADLCEEAAREARNEGKDEVTGSHVLAAIAGRRRRSSMVPDRLRRAITEGTLRVETAGSEVGQVNGLAVYVVGSFAFGTPMRISCQTGLGRRGVVAIEREVERSGAIHSKGVLVLSGYLIGTFGRDQPLAFTASLTFEQSYDEVEGDSASSAELYAILTSLAGLPVRQDIAVTGSVDQFGRIQAVGGVTEKVEGFFDVCRERGLTGTQGVIIPATNVVNLTLRPDIVEAADAGKFHIWPVEHVEQGLELLTGIPAGTRDADGAYPGESVFGRVLATLAEMRHAAQKSENGEDPPRA